LRDPFKEAAPFISISLSDQRFSVAILTPEALFLAARVGIAGIEALFISLGLLDGANQFGLFHPGCLDMVLFRYFPDFIQFHDVFSSLYT
jgi:hypothetical protein